MKLERKKMYFISVQEFRIYHLLITVNFMNLYLLAHILIYNTGTPWITPGLLSEAACDASEAFWNPVKKAVPAIHYTYNALESFQGLLKHHENSPQNLDNSRYSLLVGI